MIDPYPDEGSMYAEYLETLGFQVDVCRDAVEGLCTAAQQPPDVVVTRLRQSDPTLDGFDIVKRLKRSASTHHVPIVMITTSMFPQDRQAAADLRCDSYLLLPVPPPELAAELRRLLALNTASDGTDGPAVGPGRS